MLTKNNVQEWATAELQEMDAKVATLQGKLSQLHGDARTKAGSALAAMRRSRDAFRDELKKLGESAHAYSTHTKAALEAHVIEFKESAKKALPPTHGGAK